MSYCRTPGEIPVSIKENKTETKIEKYRRCLGKDCGRLFLSQWAGERICPDCKKGEGYQNGDNPFEEAAVFGHY